MMNFRRMFIFMVFLSVVSIYFHIHTYNCYSQIKDAIQVVQKNYSYQIVQKGVKLPDGSNTPSKVYKMRKVIT